MKNKLLLFSFLWLICYRTLEAQNLDGLQIGENSIEYISDNYLSFVKKMKSLQKGDISKVRILHFGDSHIQPNNLSGIVRKNLQIAYGNGGRGIVFPYSLAKTNGPKDFSASSSVKWDNNWINHSQKKFSIGLPGIAIKSDSSNGSLKINLRTDSSNYPYSKGFVVYSMENGKNGSILVNRQFEKKYKQQSFDTLQFSYSNLRDTLNLEFKNSRLTLHNFYFENNQKGIIYNSVGVAGAFYKDYLKNPLFGEQLTLYNLDLLIVSLGTNESTFSKYSETMFANDLDAMFLLIKQNLPHTSVIITTPSENYFLRKNSTINNDRVLFVNRILREKCQEYGFALWDLYKVMGGNGGMLRWKEAGLVNKDCIHYLKKGYQLQGKLLFEAIEKSLK